MNIDPIGAIQVAKCFRAHGDNGGLAWEQRVNIACMYTVRVYMYSCTHWTCIYTIFIYIYMCIYIHMYEYTACIFTCLIISAYEKNELYRVCFAIMSCSWFRYSTNQTMFSILLLRYRFCTNTNGMQQSGFNVCSAPRSFPQVKNPKAPFESLLAFDANSKTFSFINYQTAVDLICFTTPGRTIITYIYIYLDHPFRKHDTKISKMMKSCFFPIHLPLPTFIVVKCGWRATHRTCFNGAWAHHVCRHKCSKIETPKFFLPNSTSANMSHRCLAPVPALPFCFLIRTTAQSQHSPKWPYQQATRVGGFVRSVGQIGVCAHVLFAPSSLFAVRKYILMSEIWCHQESLTVPSVPPKKISPSFAFIFFQKLANSKSDSESILNIKIWLGIHWNGLANFSISTAWDIESFRLHDRFEITPPPGSGSWQTLVAPARWARSPSYKWSYNSYTVNGHVNG